MADQLDVGAATEAVEVERPALDGLIVALTDIRTRIADYEQRIKDLRETEAKVEGTLFDAMERQNVRSIRHARGLFMLNDLAWASIEDRATAIRWADEKHPELLTLNHSQLSAYVRAALRGDEGAEMPEGVSFRTSRKIAWRQS